MKDRIRQIMEAQHMTQQVFADFIGTTPATLSGIFNDRTRPTLNIVESIKKKIPDINTDWLMFGNGSMYRSVENPVSDALTGGDSTRQSVVSDPNPMFEFEPDPSPTPQNAFQMPHYNNGVRNTRSEIVRDEVKHIDKRVRKVTEIRVYYDDQTWESFVPAKK